MLNSTRRDSLSFLTVYFCSLVLLFAACQSSEEPRNPTPESSEIAVEGTVNRLVLAIVEDPDDEISRSGLIAMQETSLAGVQTLLSDENLEVRSAGVDIARQIPRPGSLDLLIATLTDADESIRLEAVEALGEWQNSKATAPLLALHPKEEDAQVRYEILTSLGRIGDSEAIPLLQRSVQNEDRYVRMWGMDALCTMRAPGALVQGYGLLEDPEVFVRRQVLRSCRNLFSQEGDIEIILDFTLRTDSFVEAMLARKILLNQMAGSLGAANRAIVQKESRARLMDVNNLMAGLLLAELGDTAAIPALTTAAANPDPQVRHNAAYRLGQLGQSTTIPTLLVLLQDQVPLVSGTAAGALAQWNNAQSPEVESALLAYDGPRLPPPT